MDSHVVIKMLEPFAKCLAVSQDFRLKKEIRQHIFTYLIKQSDAGLAYDEEQEVKALKRKMLARRPERRRKNKKSRREEVVDDEVEDDEAEEADEQEEQEEEAAEDEEIEAGDEDGASDVEGEEHDEDIAEMEEPNLDWGAKDPRAGGVDVVLPQLKPDYNKLADMLFKQASGKEVRSKNRRGMYQLVQW